MGADHRNPRPLSRSRRRLAMNRLRAFLLRLRGSFRRSDQDTDFRAEIEGHLQLQIDDNLRSGMSPEEARRQALCKFGSIAAVEESYRDRLGLPPLETLLRDLRFSLRI